MSIAPLTKLDAIPHYETAIWDGQRFINPPNVLKWSNPEPPPAIGTDIIVPENGCGPAVVTGYFSERGFLGLCCRLHNPPAWFVKAKKDPNVFVHGAGFHLKPRKLKVLLQQYVERVAQVEIEIPVGSKLDDEGAIAFAMKEAGKKAESATWVDGDDAESVAIYGVMTDAGEMVWER